MTVLPVPAAVNVPDPDVHSVPVLLRVSTAFVPLMAKFPVHTSEFEMVSPAALEFVTNRVMLVPIVSDGIVIAPVPATFWEFVVKL